MGQSNCFQDVMRQISHAQDLMYMKKREKLAKNIIGYDANLSYYYCSCDVMPCVNDTLVVNEKQKVFGFAQVNIEVHGKLCDNSGQIAPLFGVQEIPACNTSEAMKM